MSIIEFLEDGKVSEGKTLPSAVYNDLKESILSGKLKHDAKLTEAKLCKQYNVSRTPVREALRQLEVDGLIEYIPNRGAFVRGFTSRDVEDMVEILTSLELIAIRKAIQRITDEELEEMKEIFEFMEFYTQQRDVDKMVSINAAFHQTIYNATHNKTLQQTLTSYQTYLKHYRVLDYDASNNLDAIFNEHKDIFDAFINLDPSAGMLAMMTHMENSNDRRG